jgi:galactokinase
VNLIGEHTDYNEGFALPFAIAQGCTATVEARDDDLVRLESVQMDAAAQRRLGELQPGTGGWAAYPFGVLWSLRAAGYDVPGLDIRLDSDVPVGSGLSSSAALVCSVATAVDDLLELQLGNDRLLALTRQAENDFVGAPTGGMDQLAALNCTADHALFCDMRSLEIEQVPLELGAHTLLVVDTRAEHKHASGEYRRRRQGCEEAARQLGVRALRDVSAAELGSALQRLGDDELRRYTRHVVTEDERVGETVAQLRAGDLPAVGRLLTESHASMRDDFRITIPELDVAADTLVAAGALGARMTGGGFGGCVIGLLPDAVVDEAIAAVQTAYRRAGFRDSVAFRTRAGVGAHRLTA